MTEESFDDVLARLRGKHTGELVLTRYDGGRLNPLEPDLGIDHADPYIRIARQLLDEMRDVADVVGVDRAACVVDGDLVKIRARNNSVVYRLVGFDPVLDVHFAGWV